MWLFVAISFFYNTIDTNAFEGVTSSVGFLILMNLPTLWVLKRVTRRWSYEFCSLSINLLEIIGYTAIIYFLGGLRAMYMTPMYAALITYVGVMAPPRIPLIIATCCAVAFSLMVTLEHFAVIPHQNLTLSGYDIEWPLLVTCFSAVSGLLYVVAFIAGYTGNELKKAKDRLQEKNIQLQESERLKSEFLANMSHELRTPMNAVTGFTEMLLDTDLDEEQADYARMIQSSGNAQLSLISDILDFSKIEAGRMDFEEIEFDSELLVYDVCELIRPRIGSKPIEILCHIGDKIPSKVKGDPHRLRQVLTNLMGNACKFTQAGEIELSFDVEEEEVNRVKIHARVRDTGIGIPEDKLTAIFIPFQQVDGSTTRKYGGTGLGLSICKQISNLMGGDVWAESQVDRGSIFHFTGWLGKAKEKEVKRFASVSFSGKKVLIVDDNQTNLDILRHVLELVGMHVMALRKPGEILPVLQEAFEAEAPFDLCILDIQMPGSSGYDIAKEIRNKNYPIKDLPLVALSSSVSRDAKDCEDAGFDGFLNKPIRRENLYQMLDRIMAGREHEVKRDECVREPIITRYSIREDMKHSVHILLAEDNPVNQKLAKMMLTKAGYQVEVVNNGQEAVEKYSGSPEEFDLIFMDVQMPEMDGIEATKTIRGKGFDAIPIVAMTANAMNGHKEKCLDAGMNDYIAKPIKRELVFDIIERWVFDKKAS
jgi:two-component system sensor histidine kinase/response regulator